ncbi:MAG: hypothetical protein JRN59_00905 [Nitrososphaerota archaeon]|nr:hypothetical protein [Nitrososphaerota archaeon]
MKITRRRKAISQSLDLFIIIAAVLGVGGVVTASIYNLINSATANSSITVVGVSLKAGAAPADSPVAISVALKNNGGTPISCSTATSCQVVFAGTSTGSGVTCSTTCPVTSGGNLSWSVLTSTSGPLTFQAAPSSTLPAGGETSFVLNGPLTVTGTFWGPGTPVTINVLFGSASAQVTVVSQ